MDELLAWVVFPLLALAICTGVGLLAERLAGVELQPALVPPLGFAAAIVVLAPLFALGAGEGPGALLLIVAAMLGFVFGSGRGLAARLRPRAGAAAGLGAYALYIAPVALSGKATFLGYNLLNDTAIHLALVDWIGDHGTTYTQLPPSSYAAAIDEYVGSSYPLGSHELLAALRPLTELDPALLYQPFLALSAALAACAAYALLRGERVRAVPAALGGFAVVASQLVFSFALQGGIKEITFITCLATAAAVGAHPVRSERPAGAAALLALPVAALWGIYGVYALPWIAPLAVVAVWLLWRFGSPIRGPVIVGVGVFVLGIAADFKGSIDYYRHGHDVITGTAELGPLAGPLKLAQASGIWLTGDYRFVPQTHSWVTYLLAGLALALALTGVAFAARRRAPGALLLVVPALVAWFSVTVTSSPYIDAKALVILSPALIVVACLALRALPRRVVVGVVVVLGGAILVSDGLAYRMALPAPIDRLHELSRIDARFAGRGPILVNEFEEYTKHFMRESRGSDPYEGWNAGRARLVDPALPVAAHAYDLDQLKSSFVQGYRLIATRRSPAESRPPSNYKRVFQGRWYDVWEREGPAPLRHVPLGQPPLDPTGQVPCSAVKLLAQGGDLIAALRPRPVLVSLAQTKRRPPGWDEVPRDPFALAIHKGGSIEVPARGVEPQGAYAGERVRWWVRGSTFRNDRIVAGGKTLEVPRALNGPNQWVEARPTLGPGQAGPTLRFERPKRSLRPGDAQPDVVGPVAAVADRGPLMFRVTPKSYKLMCGGFPLDWIDVVRK